MKKKKKTGILGIKVSSIKGALPMIEKFWILVLCFITNTKLHSQYNHSSEKSSSISFSVECDLAKLPDSMDIRVVYPPDLSSPVSIVDVISVSKNNLQISIPADKLVTLYFQPFKKERVYLAWILEPGDNVIVSYEYDSIAFKGKGSSKLKLCNEISQVIRDHLKFKKLDFLVTKSTEDYLQFANDMERLWDTIDAVLESYRPLISDEAFDYIKASALQEINYQQEHKFYHLYLKLISEPNYFMETGQSISNLYDSVFSNTASFKEIRSIPVWLVASKAYLGFVRIRVLRDLNFPKHFIYRNNLRRIIECGKKEFKGLARDFFLYEILTRQMIGEYGFNEETESILAAYYEEPNNPAYKEYVRKYELSARKLDPGKKAPDVVVRDSTDKKYRKVDFTNKVTILDFEIPGNKESVLRHQVLQRIRNRFRNDTNLVLVKVIADETDKQVLRAYNILDSSYSYLIDQAGKIIIGPLDIAALGSQEFLNTIEDQLDVVKKNYWINNNDGPYLIKEGPVEKIYSVKNKEVAIDYISRERSNTLVVSTDLPNNTFKTVLKKKLTVERPTYVKPDKLLALSDIEGNFEALRNLLQKNGVINTSFDWTFGKGHLVIIGDMVDRGKQVTECLWLIYSLEEKAKAAGGYVHFILGNHEIMNLSGNLRYVQKKYTDNARLMNKDYAMDLYGPASELGKWLRTKNIIEKIGDLLFVHAGISKEINDLNLSLNEINQLARSFYDKSLVAVQSPDKKLSLIYDTKLSPFWYRNYYQEDSIRVGISTNRRDTTYKTPTRVIEDILSNFKVNKIVTGHTHYKGDGNYGKFLSTHYGGKVINTDTKHSEGFSEALYVEGERYYIVNAAGKRELLFIEKRRKIN